MSLTTTISLKLVPDCQTCEPADPWAQPNKGIFTVKNELNGEVRHLCGACLQAGVSLS